MIKQIKDTISKMEKDKKTIRYLQILKRTVEVLSRIVSVVCFNYSANGFFFA